MSNRESITRKLNILLSKPQSIRKLVLTLRENISDGIIFYDLICGCKELKVLSICLDNNGMMESSGLEQIGSSCINIVELHLGVMEFESLVLSMQHLSSLFLPLSFSNITRLSVKHFPCPGNLQDWTKLENIEGDTLDIFLWIQIVSTLSNLRSLKCGECYLSDQSLIEFSNRCKGKAKSKSLEILELSGCDLSYG